VSSLWTPEGEHRVERDDAPPPAAPAESPRAEAEPPGEPGDEEALRAEFAELERQLLEAPVEEVIANHCYGLFQLAALHLGQQPPNLDKARLAIDALGGVVDALGARLGEQSQSFVDGLAQLRLAYVQLHGAAGNGAAGGDGAGAGDGAPPPEG